MIPYEEGLHYLPVKKLSLLFGGIVPIYAGDFQFLNCFHSFRRKIKLEFREKKYLKIKILVVLQCFPKIPRY